jgi:hypothetical protein
VQRPVGEELQADEDRQRIAGEVKVSGARFRAKTAG